MDKRFYLVEIPEECCIDGNLSHDTVNIMLSNAKEVIELHAEGEDHSSPDYSIDGKDVICHCMDVFVPKDEVK